MAILDRSHRVKTAPSDEPVTEDEAKLHLGLTDDDSNARVTRLITAARQKVENDARIALVTRTIEEKLDCFPSKNHIELTVTPVSAINSVKYIDTDGVEQTFSSSKYELDTNRGLIWLADGEVWPSAKTIQNAVTLDYDSGQGAQAAVEEIAKEAILLLVYHWFDNRSAVGKTMGKTALAYESIIDQIHEATYP